MIITTTISIKRIPLTEMYFRYDLASITGSEYAYVAHIVSIQFINII